MIYRNFLDFKKYHNLESFLLHHTIFSLALSIFDIFSSIFFYQALLKHGFTQNYALGYTSMILAIMPLVQLFLIFPVITIANKVGLKLLILFGNIWLLIYFLLLYFGQTSLIILVLAPILGGIHITFYYLGYHFYFSELTDDKNQGEEIALGSFLPALVATVGPTLGGLAILYGGYNSLFLMVSILLVFSLIPLKWIPKKKSYIKINLLNIIRQITFSQKNIPQLAISGMAITQATVQYFWPLFIFITLNSIANLGFLGSGITFITILTTLFVGFLIDKFNIKKLTLQFTILDSISWVLKFFASTFFSFIALSAIQSLTNKASVMTLDSKIYKKARDSKDPFYVIERELNIGSAKFLFLFIIGILFIFGLDIKYTFLIASIAVLFLNLY